MSTRCNVNGDEELVISGISGRFPESANIEEFRKNLFDGVDMVTEDDRRWTPGIGGLPRRSGKLKHLDKFDAQYFGVHAKQAHAMDPQLRMLLEVTYEAIFDAGINPEQVRGSKTGVFIGTSSSESESEFLNQGSPNGDKNWNKYVALGCHRAMFSNRISFAYDFKGPSFTVDTACSSSLVAMAQAVTAIRTGQCDSAIVGGVHICIDPKMSLQYHNLNMLSLDGKCKSFDASASGYVRSEAIVAIFIQKKSCALRSYATILAIKGNTDGYKSTGVTFPNGKIQQVLLEEIYEESGISPADVAYVEAHGTGTLAGDPQELNALAEVLGKDRNDPLLVGSVKSLMGHAEPAAGLCAVAKILLTMQEGLIPKNLHFNTPNPNIPALGDGRLKVVTENTKFHGGIIACNSFGFGGANVHLILKSPATKEQNLKAKDNKNQILLPLLIPFSGRTKDSVRYGLEKLWSKLSFDDPDILVQQCLLHNIARFNNPGHPFRGYSIISPRVSSSTNSSIININSKEFSSCSIWFIFSGMGSQWACRPMVQNLMQLPPFSTSLLKSAAILKEANGPDLLAHLLGENPKNEDEVTLDFLSIASIQIALVDLLRSIGVHPQGIIGHSVGELVAAYADDCLTIEETILCALARGQAIVQSRGHDPLRKAGKIGGKMAAVGLTWEEAYKKCPPGIIFPACHNAQGSVTVSGPSDDVSSFVRELENQGIFAREVSSSGMAFHSPYINHVEPRLRELLAKIVKGDKIRSNRWISSSVLEDNENSKVSRKCSVDYIVNNLVSPVRFQEALAHVPRMAEKNVVVLEIGPHCILQAILKRELPNARHVPLVNKNNGGSSSGVGNGGHVGFLLGALGEIYKSGGIVDFRTLNRDIKPDFPVTVPGSLSSLVKWNHENSWTVAKCSIQKHESSPSKIISKLGEVDLEISLKNKDDEFYTGHVIDDRLIFPATGYILLVWKAFAKTLGTNNNFDGDFNNLSVAIENITIFRATILPEDGAPVKFSINILKGSGAFEIYEGGSLVVSGKITQLLEKTVENQIQNGNHKMALSSSFEVKKDCGKHKEETEIKILDKEGVYKELRLRGYLYSGMFQGIHSMTMDGSMAQIEWMDNWVSFLDTVLHFTLLSNPTRSLYVPTYLSRAILSPQKFLHQFHQSAENSNSNFVPVFYNKYTKTVSCPGVQLERLSVGLITRKIESMRPPSLILEKYNFLPYFCPDDSEAQSLTMEECLQIMLDIVLENTEGFTLKIVEILQKVEGKTLESCSIAGLTKTLVLGRPSALCQVAVVDLGQENLGQKQDSVEDDSLFWNNLEKHDIAGIKIQDFPEFSSKMGSDSDLIVVHDFSLVEKIAPVLKTSSFVLFHCLKEQGKKAGENWKKMAEELDKNIELTFVGHRISKGHGHILLFRKVQTGQNGQKLPPPITIEIDLQQKSSSSRNPCSNIFPLDYNYSWIEDLKKAMELKKDGDDDDDSSRRILLISRETRGHSSGVIGLVNCLRKEPGGHRIRCIVLTDSQNQPLDFSNLSSSGDLVMNIYQNGVWGSYRHLPLFSKNFGSSVVRKREVSHAYLSFTKRGDFSSLQWIEGPLSIPEIHPDQGRGQDRCQVQGHSTWSNVYPQLELCTVHYSPISEMDVALISGQIPLDSVHSSNSIQNQDETILQYSVLGAEFSGFDSKQNRVMGILPKRGGISTRVLTHPDFVWKIPKNWTLPMAASVPLPFATAFYALCLRHRTTPGENVLISGKDNMAVKIAVISIALSLKCAVFITVNSKEEARFLKSIFPILTDDSFVAKFVEDSVKNGSIEHQIVSRTKGHGVDLVFYVTSLLDPDIGLLEECAQSLSPNGKLLKFGEIEKNSSIKQVDINVTHVDLRSMLRSPANFEERRELHLLMTEGIESGVVRPLPFTIFSTATKDKIEIEQALESVHKKTGWSRVILEISDEKQGDVANSNSKNIEAIPRTYFDPSKIYLIIGGLGGIGLELAGWLISRGARMLALISRSGVRSGFQQFCLNKWRQTEGIKITAPLVSDADFCDVESALNFLRRAADDFESAPNSIGGIFNLAMVLEDGLMFSQTPAKFQNVSRPKVNVTIALDSALRTLKNSCLDHFVVFSSVSSGRGAPGLSNYAWSNSVTERIIETRRRDGLPGLAIQYGPVGDVGRLQDEMKLGHEALVSGTLTQRIFSVLDTLDTFLDESLRGDGGHSTAILASSVIPPKKKTKGKGSTLEVKGQPEKSFSLLEKFGVILGLSLEEMKSANPGKKLVQVGMDSLMGLEVGRLIEQKTGVNLQPVQMLQLTFGQLQAMDVEIDPETSPILTEETEKIDNSGNFEFSPVQEAAEDFSPVLPSSVNLPAKNGDFVQQDDDFSKKVDFKKTSAKICHFFKNSCLDLLFYIMTAFSLLILFSFALFSRILRFFMQTFINLRCKNKKLMSRPYDQYFAATSRPSNMIFVTKFEGTPDRSKILEILENRVINWTTNLSKPESNFPMYKPYDLLRWRIQSGYFFYSWILDQNFKLENHVVFEQFEKSGNLDDEGVKAAQYYYAKQWDETRPRWEVKTLEVKRSNPKMEIEVKPEFLLILAAHHSYGDAMSILDLFQHALADPEQNQGQNPNLKEPPKNRPLIFENLDKKSENPQKSAGILKKMVERSKYLIKEGHQSLLDFSKIWRDYLECQDGDHKGCGRFDLGFTKISLTKVKKIKNRETNLRLPINVLVLSILSKVYQKIYKHSKMKGWKPPKKLLVALPYAILQDDPKTPKKLLGLSNNVVHAQLGIDLEQGDSDYQKKLNILQQNLERAVRAPLLKVAWLIFSVGFSSLTAPLMRLFAKVMPSPSVLWTNVPVHVVDPEVTYLGRHRMLDFYGYTAIVNRGHATVATCIDSNRDLVTLSIVVDGSALRICPDFVQQFLTLFQEEVDRLVAEGQS